MDRISSFAKDYIQDFKHLNSAPLNEHWVAMKNWSAPIAENVKTKFDGAVFGESNEASIGVVIRNFEGKVMVALSEKIKKLASVEILELLVARRAISFTLDTGFNNSIFEGDSDMVVISLQGRGMENSQGGHIIKDIQSFVNSLRNYSFSDVVR